MSSPLADVDSNTRQPATKSSRASKIPSRPTSQMTSSEGSRTPLAVSATGSPLPAAPLPPRDTMSPTPFSKIPKKAQTTPSIPASRSVRPKSGGSSSHSSSLPLTRGLRDTPTVTQFPSLIYKKPNPLSSRDKPLPSPPVAQVINPNSPPKAQRTLIDAEAGTLSDEEWPILRPEHFSSTKNTLRSSYTVIEKEQQQRSVSERSTPRQNANLLVESRPLTASATYGARSTFMRCQEHNLNSSAEHGRLAPTIGTRRLSSNNPYAEKFHAYSPKADVAINSPLARKSSAPLTIQVPTRMSSKRTSLPLLNKDGLEYAEQESTHDIKQGSEDWPLPESEHGEVLSGELIDPTPEQQTNVATIDASHARASVQTELDPHLSDVSLTDHVAPLQDSSVTNSSLDLEIGYRKKILSWKESEPNRGPGLRIHQDADTLILGLGDVGADDPDLPDKHQERMSLGRSLGALAQRMSKQAKSTLASQLDSDMPTPVSTLAEVDKIESVKTLRLRSLTPQLEVSGRVHPWSPSSPTVHTSNVNRFSDAPPALETAVSNFVRVGALSAPSFESQRSASPARIGNADEVFDAAPAKPTQTDDGKAPEQEEYTSDSPAKKAKKVMGMGQHGPSYRSSKRLTPSWMAPTMSSLKSKRVSVEPCKASSPRKMVGRMSSRDIVSNPSASGSTSSTSRHTAQSNTGISRAGPSKLRASMSVTPASERSAGANSVSRSTQTGPELLGQSSSLSPVDTDAVKHSRGAVGGEVKKAAILKVKAKRSLRNLFHKSDTTPTKKMPKTPDPKRASIATSSKTLAKRISKNFSKAQLPRMPEPKADVRTSSEAQDKIPIADTKLQATTASPGGTTSNAVPEAQPAFYFASATVLTKLTNIITSMSAEDPERLRVLELAEAVLHCVETSNQAKLNCENARKHARDAELNYARIQLEVDRIHKLCETGSEAIFAMTGIAKSAGLKDVEMGKLTGPEK